MFVNRGKITGKPIEENWDKDVFGPEQLSELYKGKPFEGGHRVPFIARWPGTGPGLDIVQLEFDWAEVR